MNRYLRFVVPSLASAWEEYAHRSNFQGFDGPVTFAGFTPDLDDFAIRIEDGPGNVYVDEASRIGDAVGRTNFAGYRVEPGTIWQAKSEHAIYYFTRSTLTSTPRVYHGSDLCSNGRDFGAIPLPGTEGQGPQPRFHLTGLKQYSTGE